MIFGEASDRCHRFCALIDRLIPRQDVDGKGDHVTFETSTSCVFTRRIIELLEIHDTPILAPGEPSFVKNPRWTSPPP